MFISVKGEFRVEQKIAKVGGSFYAGEYTTEEGVRMLEAPHIKLTHFQIGRDENGSTSGVRNKLIALSEEGSIWIVAINYSQNKILILSNNYEESITLDNLDYFLEVCNRNGRVVLEFFVLNDQDQEEHLFSFEVPPQGIQLYGYEGLSRKMAQWQVRN